MELLPKHIEEFLSQLHFPPSEPEVITIDKPFKFQDDDNSIELAGEVIITVDMDLQSHSLYVKGNLTLKGAVLNGTIVVLGSLKVEKEIRDCNCYSLDNITVFRPIRTALLSFRNIELLNESDKSSFNAAGYVTGENSAIRGGYVTAGETITLNKAYSMGPSRELILSSGDKEVLIYKVRLVEANLHHLGERLNHVKESISKLIKMLIAKNLLGTTNPALETLKKNQVFFEQQLKFRGIALEKLKEKPVRGKNIITINQYVSGDVKVYVDEAYFRVTSVIANKVTFNAVNNDIEITGL